MESSGEFSVTLALRMTQKVKNVHTAIQECNVPGNLGFHHPERLKVAFEIHSFGYNPQKLNFFKTSPQIWVSVCSFLVWGCLVIQKIHSEKVLSLYWEKKRSFLREHPSD